VVRRYMVFGGQRRRAASCRKQPQGRLKTRAASQLATPILEFRDHPSITLSRLANLDRGRRRPNGLSSSAWCLVPRPPAWQDSAREALMGFFVDRIDELPAIPERVGVDVERE